MVIIRNIGIGLALLMSGIVSLSGCGGCAESDSNNTAWNVVFEEKFEEQKEFTFPENWWYFNSWGEWDWHLECPDSHAEIQNGSVAITHNPGTTRGCIATGTHNDTIFNASKMYVSYDLLLPVEAVKYYKSIFISIERFLPYEHRGDEVMWIGFTPAGWVVCGKGYTPDPNTEDEYTEIATDAFTLSADVWYHVRMEVDFDNHTLTYFSIKGNDINKEWHLNEPFAYNDNLLIVWNPDGSHSTAVYLTACDFVTDEGITAFFDNVEVGVS